MIDQPQTPIESEPPHAPGAPVPPVATTSSQSSVGSLGWTGWTLFALGFIAWFAFTTLVWSQEIKDLSGSDRIGVISTTYGCLVLPVGGAAFLLLILVKRLRPAALGMVAAIAANLVLSLFAGTVSNAACLIPFYLK